MQVCSAFGLTQLIINKPTRSTLKTSSLLDHILTNSKESVTQHGVTTLGLSENDFIFCTREKNVLNQGDITVSVRTYKNYFKKLLEEWLTKMKIPNSLLFSCADTTYNHLSNILQDTINDKAPIRYSNKGKYKTIP